MKSFLPPATASSRLRLAGALLPLICATGLRAQTIWDGGGGDANFLTAANWTGDTAPTSGTTTVVQFAGSTNTSPALNSNFEVLQLTLNSGASSFALSGTGVLSVYGAGSAGIGGQTQGITNLSTNLQTVSNTLLLTGNSQLYAVNGSMIFNGGVDINGKQLMLRAGSASASITYNGVISGTSPSTAGLVLRGSSTTDAHINGANTFTVAGINLWEGNVYLGNNTALGVASNVVSVGQTTLTSNIALLTDGTRTIAQTLRLISKAGAGTYTIGGSTADVSTYSGNITVNTSSGTANSQTAMPLIVTAASGGRVNFTGSIIRDTASTGTGDTLTKTGAGIVALSGTNTYSGTTAVNAGTLLVNGSLSAGGGAVMVADSASLGGEGTINRTVSVSAGGIFTPGDFNGSGVSQTGNLAIVGNLTFVDTSSLRFDLGTSSDTVSVTGNLTLDGLLTVTGGTGFGAGTYTLFSYTGTFLNNSLTLSSLPAGYSYALDTATTGLVNLTVSAIPEPASVAMYLGMAALVGSVCLRRRAR